jgi:hypothetical protein
MKRGRLKGRPGSREGGVDLEMSVIVGAVSPSRAITLAWRRPGCRLKLWQPGRPVNLYLSRSCAHLSTFRSASSFAMPYFC